MRKDSVIRKASAAVIKAPLIYPFRTALGQHDYLENVLFSVELSDGTRGYGEAAVATHITGQTVKETLDKLKAAAHALAGRDVREYASLSHSLNEQWPRHKSAVAAVEMGLLDALTRQRKIPLWKFFGRRPERIRTDVTLVIAGLSQTEENIRRFYRLGFRAFKVKIGRDQDLDYQRVCAVKRLAPAARIYLDANQGYSAEETLRFLTLLKRRAVIPDLVEQPVPKSDFEGLRKVSRSSEVLVCADESASSPADVRKIIKHRAAGAVNLKLMKFGLLAGREVALLAREHGLKLMMGGMMESSLAMTAAAHFAAGLGGFDFIDLDCPFFIKKGWETNPYVSPQGVYDLKKAKYGIGIDPAGT